MSKGLASWRYPENLYLSVLSEVKWQNISNTYLRNIKINRYLSYICCLLLFENIDQNIDWYFNRSTNWIIVSFYFTHEIFFWNNRSIKKKWAMILQWWVRMPVFWYKSSRVINPLMPPWLRVKGVKWPTTYALMYT